MKNWLVIGACTLAIACGESTRQDTTRKMVYSSWTENKEDSLYHEIMDGHDVGMAKMSKLGRAAKGVTGALDGIARIPAKKADTTYKCIDRSAEKAKLCWMRNGYLDERI